MIERNKKAEALRRGRFALTLGAALVLAACAGTPKAPPQMDLPKAAEQTAPAEMTEWWHSFGDPVLDAYVAEALAHNSDVELAAARVRQSRGALAAARTNMLPTVDVGMTGARVRSADDTRQPGQPKFANTYTAGFTVAYEIDLFGRLAAEREVAAQNLAASQYGQEVTRSAIAAQTARAYFTLRALDADEALYAGTLKTRDDLLALQKRRFDAGVIGAYAYALVEAERSSVAAALPRIRAAREQAEVALSLLLGRSPRELAERLPERGSPVDVLARAPEIPAGLHAELLQRRPDVRAAEAQLAASSANVEAARARWFPTISLTGFFGGESGSLSDLLSGATRNWNVAGAIAQPLVGLARVSAAVDQAKAQRDQAELTYRQAARQAYADALSALSSARGAREALQATETLRNSRTRVYELAAKTFGAGQTSRLDLLDAERERLESERQLVTARRDRLTSLVDVYQSLGGGWSEQPGS